jgi:hypothetical protein
MTQSSSIDSLVTNNTKMRDALAMLASGASYAEVMLVFKLPFQELEAAWADWRNERSGDSELASPEIRL